MQRRNFLRSLALGSAAFYSSKLYAVQWMDNDKVAVGNVIGCSRPDCVLPVIFEVDTLIIGGSSAGVAAAVKASEKSANVALISSEPYLGWDICGTLNLWKSKDAPKSSLSDKIWNNGNLTTPLHVKRTLDDSLIENDIPFLYSSFISNILFDDNNKIAGVVIANRSGEQVIRTKMVVDATQNATAAKIAGADITDFKPGKNIYQYTVIGNEPVKGLDYDILSPAIVKDEKEYRAVRYKFAFDIKDESHAAYEKAEQQARNKTWDKNQVDAADYLSFVPNQRIIAQKPLKKEDGVDEKNVDIQAFIAANHEQLLVLNGFADVPAKVKRNFISPSSMMLIGTRIGEYVGEKSKSIVSSKINHAKNGSSEQKVRVTCHTDEMREKYKLDEVQFNNEELPVLGNYDVLVMGGGTAGACAGIGAARNGAKTLVVEYLHGMGGLSTLGKITNYYHGYRKGFTEEIDREVKGMEENHSRKRKKYHWWVSDFKMEWYRKEYLKAGGELWFGVLGCGAVVDQNKVKGVVVATPQGKGIIYAKKVVDSTGSGDIAIAAGADYKYTGKETMAVQGAGLPAIVFGKEYFNTDWTFINDTDVFDITRTFVAANSKYKGEYDVGKLLQTRERRRVVCDYEVSVLDVYNNRTFEDVLSYHYSSFDTHGYTIDPFFTMKPPKGSGMDESACVPLRAMLPKGLENIIVTGLGICAHRDAMPVIRMQPCLQNQGYSVGMFAKMAIDENATFRNANLKKLQKKLVEMGNLPKEIVTGKDSYPPEREKVMDAIKKLDDKLENLELILWDLDKNLNLIKKQHQTTGDEKQKLIYAWLLGLYGYDDGFDTLLNAVSNYDKWDEGWNYTGMGQFGLSSSYLDGLIMALGRCKRREALPVIHKMAAKLTEKSELSHFRAIAEATETIRSNESVPMLVRLLEMPGVKGHTMDSFQEAEFYVKKSLTDTSIRNDCLREIFLARALYRCGDHKGLAKSILTQYANDLRGHYSRHAMGVLKEG